MRNESTTELENLVLYLQEDGTYAMKIVTYHYTEQDRLDQANGLPVDLTDKVSYQSINDDGVITSIFSLEVGCITVYFDYCGENVAAHAENLSQCDAVETDYLEFGDCSGGGGYTGMSDSSGTTYSNTGNTQGGGSGIGTSPIEPPEELTVEEELNLCMLNNIDESGNLISTITQNEMDWLLGQGNYILQPNGLPNGIKYQNEINNYLKANGCTLENQLFVADAVEALMNNGEVDFVDEVILDPTFKNNQKVKCVYDKLKGLSSTIFNEIINDNFDSSKSAKITFSTGNIITGEDAQTRYSYNSVLGANFNIVFDNTFLNNASPLEIAFTIIHENIHAELLDRCGYLGLISAANFNYTTGQQLIVFNSSPTVYSIHSAIYNQLLTEYGAYTQSSQWNHNFFNVLNYRNKMEQNLVNIHPWLNDVNNDFLTNVNQDPFNSTIYTLEQLMGYISWIGLEDTQEYQSNIFSNSTELTKKLYVQFASRNKYTNNCN